MIVGMVDAEGIPMIALMAGDDSYTAIVDTGFNGDLELPEKLYSWVNPRLIGRRWAELAGGRSLEEELYLVDFPFDGRTVTAEASFVSAGETILIGTGLLGDYRLEIDFPQTKVILKKNR